MGGGSFTGPAEAARLSFPLGVLALPDGDLVVADTYAYRVLRVSQATHEVASIAGTGIMPPEGSVNAKLRPAQGEPGDAVPLGHPAGLALSPDGRTLYIVEVNTHSLRSLDLASGVLTTLIGSGNVEPQLGAISRGAVSSANASLAFPYAVATCSVTGAVAVASSSDHGVFIVGGV